MDFSFYFELVKAVFKELWRYRYYVLIMGFVIGLAGAGTGFFWQEKYASRATLYADQKNIISPLLQGQAATTEVENQLQVVKDILLSQKALESVIETEGFLQGGEGVAQRTGMIARLRNSVSVRSLARGDSYIEVSYQDISPERAFGVVKKLVDLFIAESSESKRTESRQAFTFIDNQAATYKEQLRIAEKKLKDFNAANLDGTEAQAQGNIESLRQEIETVELDLEQAGEKTQSLKLQVEQESRYLTEKARSDVYNERIVEATNQLDELRLIYTDNHPDVIALREHIAALKEARATGDEQVGGSINSDVENPVYDELRSALAASQVERDSVQRRLNSLNQRLNEARERLKRIVARNAELTELTRDYDVTKDLYEDLLARKEQARLSMTLDIEGQGLNYKIQQPANYPQVPTGLQFIHIVLFGVLGGIVVPFGIAVAYVFLDPRIRFANQIQEAFDVPLLAEIPHLSSSLTTRLVRSDAKIFMVCFVLLAGVYCSLVLGMALIR